MLAWLLHIANSSPLYKERFYAMKTRILKRFAIKDGIDLQELPGKHCWSCDGSGIFVHTYSGDEDTCHKCYGDGWYERPCYVTLQRWQLGRYVFHEPIERSWGKCPSGIVVTSILRGYVKHRHYSYRSVKWASLLLGLMFDRAFAAIAWHDIYRCWWVVRVASRRCIDCKRRLWNAKRWRCKACEFLAVREKSMRIDEIPFYEPIMPVNMPVPKKKPTANRLLAQRIAAELFTSGNGSVAQRLVLELEGGKYAGGWGIKPMVDRLETIIGEHDVRKITDVVK